MTPGALSVTDVVLSEKHHWKHAQNEKQNCEPFHEIVSRNCEQNVCFCNEISSLTGWQMHKRYEKSL